MFDDRMEKIKRATGYSHLGYKEPLSCSITIGKMQRRTVGASLRGTDFVETSHGTSLPLCP